jgi:hypothetical protein
MWLAALAVMAGLVVGLNSPACAARGELELTVVDTESRESLPVQLQLRNAKGRRVPAPGLPVDGDWQVVDGHCVLTLPPGAYSFRIRRGLEYRERTGQFVLKSGDADSQQVDLPRFASLREEGWWSGDLEVYRRGPTSHLAQRMLASDLHVASPVTWTNPDARPELPIAVEGPVDGLPVTTARFVAGEAGLDRRIGGVTLLFGSALHDGASPAALPSVQALLPSPRAIVEAWRTSNDRTHRPSHVHFASLAHADLPVAVACGTADSVGLLTSQFTEAGAEASEQDQPLDRVLFPGPHGPAEWSHRILYHLLDTGHRMVPGAGSGSGLGSNPLGYHRVYVHCEEPFTADGWWSGLRAGRVVVTNGPLLRPRLQGELPGYTFRAEAGERLELELDLQLATQDKIQYLEVVKNGRPLQQVRLEEWKARRGQLPPVVMEESGWVVVRVVADHPTAYRAATSGAFYVEFGERPRISKASAQFFLDWIYDRARRVRRQLETQGITAAAAEESLEDLRRARDYWQDRLQRANAP